MKLNYQRLRGDDDWQILAPTVTGSPINIEPPNELMPLMSSSVPRTSIAKNPITPKKEKNPIEFTASDITELTKAAGGIVVGLTQGIGGAIIAGKNSDNDRRRIENENRYNEASLRLQQQQAQLMNTMLQQQQQHRQTMAQQQSQPALDYSAHAEIARLKAQQSQNELNSLLSVVNTPSVATTPAVPVAQQHSPVFNSTGNNSSAQYAPAPQKAGFLGGDKKKLLIIGGAIAGVALLAFLFNKRGGGARRLSGVRKRRYKVLPLSK